MGYSLSVTDIAAGFLFRESLQHLAAELITVVDFASDEEWRHSKQAELIRAYNNVFPLITESQVDLPGARQWVFDNLTQWLYDSHGNPVAFIYGTHVIARSGRFFGTMIDSSIVWGEGQGDQSTYRGQVEGNCLVFQDDLKEAPKYMKVEVPDLPGVPAVNPFQIAATALRP